MWIVIRWRRTLLSAIRNVSELALQLNPRFHVGSRRTKFEIVLLMTSVLILLIIQVLYFFYQEWNKCLEALAFPLVEQSPYLNEYIWLVLFSIVMTYNIGAATCFLMLLLCYNSYFTLAKIMNSYGKVVKEELICGNCTYKQISRYISTFVDITQKVQDIDQALGAIAFFLYVTVICNFFNTISVALGNSKSYQTPVVHAYLLLQSVTAIVTFFVLTYSGALVQKGSENMKQNMTECSNLISKLAPSFKVMVNFTMLLENVNKSKLVVTGWNMFTIQKGFILSVAGLVMTYGILMYQMDVLKTE
ncbi:uncharacterized protein NPIL_650201 [Nephila pilipes]|uniref:Gustatory receptor n=1 Tax=Nephila pilipes TaxID=299642 RepID=A0A8X6P3L1_NEPPI|nr:uncharacterized protein NPIL_650201 [Nephila pilipes]